MTRKGTSRGRGSASHTYSSDRPITSKRHDVLNRTKFAEHLATDLRSWNGKDSLVVALYGAWGSGKTSVKNMVLEALRGKRGSAVPVMEFNPWQLSGTGSIPIAFFRELGIMLGKVGSEDEAKKRSSKLERYGRRLLLSGSALETLASLAAFLGLPGVPQVVGSLKAAGSVVKEGSEALAADGDGGTAGLQDIKGELCELMAKLPRAALVVIDDIDRLTSEEIRQVFQLVKANADFPRLVYLLVFEREIVTKALDAVSVDRGDEFLEKIVQVGYHIPRASAKAVQKALFDGLNSHLATDAVSKHWDQRRWGDLFSDGISGYFRNLRHVKRYLASFSFHIAEHRGNGSFEVNPVDLVGLETLRVFAPGVYERLPSARTILTRYEGPTVFGGIEQEVVDQELSSILSVVSTANRDRVKGILEALFPPILPTYAGEHVVSGYHDQWLRQLRVCHPDHFDKYFTLVVPDDDLSQSELDALLRLTAESKGFVGACEALKKRGLLGLAFQRLDAYKDQIPISSMASLVQALCDMSDGFPMPPRSSTAAISIDIMTHAWRLCHFGLKREPDEEKRFNTLRNAFLQARGLALPFELASLGERVGDRLEVGCEFLVSEANNDLLKQICVRRFREAMRTMDYRLNPQCQVMLRTWSAWESDSELRAMMKTQIRNQADALWLLEVLLFESHSYGREHRIRYWIQLNVIERFIEVSTLSELLADVRPDTLGKRGAIAFREFHKAQKRRTEGKPDNIRDVHGEPSEEIAE